jgi:hypothetical protein
MGADRLGQHEKVTRGVLGRPKGGPCDRARGIVYPAHQSQARAAIFKPVMGRAIGLEQHSCLSHPLATVVPLASAARSWWP